MKVNIQKVMIHQLFIQLCLAGVISEVKNEADQLIRRQGLL